MEGRGGGLNHPKLRHQIPNRPPHVWHINTLVLLPEQVRVTPPNQTKCRNCHQQHSLSKPLVLLPESPAGRPSPLVLRPERPYNPGRHKSTPATAAYRSCTANYRRAKAGWQPLVLPPGWYIWYIWYVPRGGGTGHPHDPSDYLKFCAKFSSRLV